LGASTLPPRLNGLLSEFGRGSQRFGHHLLMQKILRASDILQVFDAARKAINPCHDKRVPPRRKASSVPVTAGHLKDLDDSHPKAMFDLRKHTED
jgi:hypothetical protein